MFRMSLRSRSVSDPLLVLVERADQSRLVLQVRRGDGIDQLAAGVGERDQRAAAVVRIGLAADQARLLELVQPLGRAARREHRRVREVGRAQPVVRPAAAQRGEHVVPARLEAVRLVDGLQPRLELAREPRDAADDPDRRRVEVRPLGAPLLDDRVDAVAFGHRTNFIVLKKLRPRKICSRMQSMLKDLITRRRRQAPRNPSGLDRHVRRTPEPHAAHAVVLIRV